jgi:hypothetical protein
MATSQEQWAHMQIAMRKLAEFSDPLDRSNVDLCRIFDSTTTSPNEHNCVGCNLKDLVIETANVVDVIVAGSLIQQPTPFRLFVGMINSYWEQLCNCFDLVALDNSYRTKGYFPTFLLVRRWTNFFKHPGPFGYLMHHPTFVHSGTHEFFEAKKNSDAIVLNDEYVESYFTADASSNQTKHISYLQSYKTAVVVFPDLVAVADGIVNETGMAIDLLTTPIFSQRIAKRSSILDFYCSPSLMDQGSNMEPSAAS